MKRLLASILITAIAALAVLTGGRIAQASWDWCFEDPIVDINGSRVTIEIGIPVSNLPDIKGPVTVRIAVPKKVDAIIVFVTNDSFQEDVRIVRTDAKWEQGEAVPVSVTARADGTTIFPVAMRVSYPDGTGGTSVATITGTANRQLRYDFWLR